MRLPAVERLGFKSQLLVEGLGGLAIFTLGVLRSAFSPPFRFRRFVDEVFDVGVLSLSIVCLSGFAVGAVLGLQGYDTLVRFGAEANVGAMVGLSLVKELGPVLTALVVAGRVGSGIAAEIGSMVVTDQVDAIRTLGASPIKKIVVPKVLATLIMLPCLTILADAIGLAGGLFVSVFQLRVEAPFYLSQVNSSLLIGDVLSGLGKSVYFGFAIATVGCYVGLNTSGGADGVGRSTTQSVVIASLAILIGDFFLTKLFMAF